MAVLATDKVRFFPNEQILQVINCWQCHAGYKRSTEEQLVNHVGMFPQLQEVA